MDKPLEPGVRKKGRNTYQVSTEYLKEDFEKMGPEKFKQLMKDKKPQTMKKGGLSAGQKKIAAKAPPPDKIDAKDFAVLKKEKAKGRGMGLQDESIKPGKVMKARYGTAIMTIAEKAMSGAKSYKNYLKGLKKATSERRSEVIKSPEYSPSNYKGTKSYKALGIKNEDEFYKIKMKDPKFAGAVYKTAGSKKIPAAVDNRIRQLNANIRMDKINQNPKAKKMYEEGVTFGKKTRKMAGGMMKAKRGHFSESNISGHKRVMGVLPTINKVTPTVKGKELPKASDILKKKKLPGAIGTALGIGAMMVPAAYGVMKQYKDYKSAKNRDEAKVKKMGGGMAKKYSVGGGADMGAEKKRPNNPGTSGEPMRPISKEIFKKAKAYALAESMKDTDRLTNRDIQEATKALKPSQRKSRRYAGTPGYLPKPAIGKMGGGMMQRPMGYKSGTMVKARGCKLGRTRPTKMY